MYVHSICRFKSYSCWLGKIVAINPDFLSIGEVKFVPPDELTKLD